MPKSKRARLVHLTQVQKKGREHKDKLFENVRAAVPEYRYCFVFRIDNSRNTHLKTVRQELTDCKYVFFFPSPLPDTPNPPVRRRFLLQDAGRGPLRVKR